MSRAPSRAFDCKQSDRLKTRFVDFLSEFLGTMKVCSCEISGIVCGISMLAGCKIGSNDVPKSGVAETPAGKSVDQRGKAGNCRREKESSWFDDPVRFTKG